ncbi:MAG: DNA internalization-related competence protein ComEC/Rec2 [Magnetococcales bacterium]|nr:DNA internalization-related competence protein ComEC/Rec2 [Magnetococcales bacterium]
MGRFLAFLILGLVLVAELPPTGGWGVISGAGVAALGTFFASSWRKGWLVVLAGLVVGLTTAWWNGEQYQGHLPEKLSGEEVITGVVADREDRARSVKLILAGVTASMAEVGAVSQGERLDSVDDLEGGSTTLWRAEGLVQVTVYRQDVFALPGDRVRFSARLFPPSGHRVPGSFDYGAWLKERGIVATGYARGDVEILESTEDWRWNRLRQHIFQWITHHLPPESQGMVAAILVGKRGGLSHEVRENLVVAGVFHLVAISGLHLGLVAFWGYGLIRLALALVIPLSARWDVKRLAAGLAIFPMLAYAFLAGWPVSTQRAAVMAGAFLLSIALSRNPHPWRALGVAAMIVLVWRPGQLFEAGFLLSFLAVGVLLWLWWPGRSPIGNEKAPTGLAVREESGVWGQLRGLVITTVVLGVVLSPISAHFFHRLTPYGFVGNLVAVPWVSLVAVPLGLGSLVVAPFSDTLGAWLLLGTGWSLDLVRLGSDWLAALPGAWQRLPGPPLDGIAWGVVGGLGVVALPGRMAKGFSLLVMVAALFWPRVAPSYGVFHLAALEVGQAQSVAVRGPEGAWSIVDAGGAVTPRFNIGEGVISSYLWHHGVTELKHLVVSHPQADHMAGARRVLRNFAVESLWLGQFPVKEREKASYRALMAMAEARGVAIRRFAVREAFQEGELIWRILPPWSPGEGRNHNDRSVVVEAAFGAHRFLFPGDIEKAGEEWLLGQGVLQPVTLLMAPHHGSNSSSSPEFIAATQPEGVIFSVGRRNRYGFPKQPVVDRWRESGAQLWRTDRHGTVIVESDGEAWWVKPVE